ncbi:hypothetical protein [Methanobacterium formicicum]|uniref:Uncharacterized protein n=1 Tax=Methanobacterium formicicum TaxID=2162 RepID=A0A090I8B3_METFO|nr:hypothetical protein [Methanobacterium formicicum]MDH2660049.1 hypothetical protein [Methanobacterium formicicum]CEA14530.1 hypothetical protein DSM1535_2210 [Methanobacterium formicicum]
METKKDDFLAKFDRMLETGEIMRFRDVKRYFGKFTGKMVKPLEDDLNYKKFRKGDIVVIFNAEEYLKYRKGYEFLSRDIKDSLKEFK